MATVERDRSGQAARRLARRQRLTVGLLVVGYAGYYLCRSNLSATLPLIIDDLAGRGMDAREAQVQLGRWVVMLGTIAYALGKFASGGLTDVWGGRRTYLIGMGGAVVCTLAFALGGSLPVFTLAWFGNRLIQSLGWPGMIKITSRWFSHASYNTVMGVISLSFLFGDAAARAFIGQLIGAGLGWRGVFLVAAGVLAGIWMLSALLLRESPGELGLDEPATNPENLFGKLGEDPHPESAGPLVATLARSPAFWIVCLLSVGLTLLRETFNNWTPTYLVQGVGLGKGAAAGMSGLFPLVGGVSVILAGVLADRLGRRGRASIILGGIALGAVALGYLGSASFAGRPWPALMLVALVAFLLIGPYSYLAGAISLDFGGKRGGATACGIIDGVGYLFGGVVAGEVVARVSVTLGWQGVFVMLAVIAGATALVAAWFLADQLRSSNPASEMEEGLS
jgi:OPA family glycerol-3-phosphate transporter-like MFS transporter